MTHATTTSPADAPVFTAAEPAATHLPLVDVSALSPEKAVARLIEYAVYLGASDLFLLCNMEAMSVQVRQHGIVRTISHLTGEFSKRCLQYIKAAAGIDLTERRRPLDGRWIYQQAEQPPVDLRINTIPTMFGEDMTIRLLVRCNDLFTLNKLGMTDSQHADVEAMLGSSAGLVLVTGPTGSGKSMTLYGCLRRLNNGERKINTIEDPIEYPIAGLRQSQVNPAVGLGFIELLRGVLRQAPDVIMIGEIRDAETAETTVRAANSGHLVFATIHAATAAAALQSLRALGVHPHFLSVAMRGIVAQRLVRTLCPQCKASYDVSDLPEFFSEVRPWLGPDEGRFLCSPMGCQACGQTGYGGRTGVFEVLNVSRTIRNLIFEGRSAREVHEKALEEQMLSFRQSALLKVARGETSTDEVFRVIPTDVLLVDD